MFHDDQHGTAVVVLAALLNGGRLVERPIDQMRVAVLGSGAAGVAIVKILLSAGGREILVCDREGILHPGRADGVTASKRWLIENTNPGGEEGKLKQACTGAHAFIGVSGPGTLPLQALECMAPDPLVFALANPVPEIMPEEAEGHVAVMATGRSDYPNQINNALAFPGIFRGALDVPREQYHRGHEGGGGPGHRGLRSRRSPRPRARHPERLRPERGRAGYRRRGGGRGRGRGREAAAKAVTQADRVVRSAADEHREAGVDVNAAVLPRSGLEDVGEPKIVTHAHRQESTGGELEAQPHIAEQAEVERLLLVFGTIHRAAAALFELAGELERDPRTGADAEGRGARQGEARAEEDRDVDIGELALSVGFLPSALCVPDEGCERDCLTGHGNGRAYGHEDPGLRFDVVAHVVAGDRSEDRPGRERQRELRFSGCCGEREPQEACGGGPTIGSS